MAAASRDTSSRRLAGGRRKDRLSELPDGILGNILSFLPTKEAGRAAVLSQLWRHMFANVHTLSFEQDVVQHQGDDYTFYVDSQGGRSLNGDFLDDVSAALLCRRRCGGAAPNASLRAFRVAFDGYDSWDGAMLETWLAHVLQQSSLALDLDLVFKRSPPCQGRGWWSPRGMFESGIDVPEMPRRVFSCAVMRSLRLGCCHLNPPEVVAFPALEILHLVNVQDSNDTIQRLINGCPRLADLTLELCCTLQRVSVLDRRLRRFALRCYHGAVRVTLNASELAKLDYKGAVPAESLLELHGTPRIASSTIEFCGTVALSKVEELARFRKLLETFVDANHLHLQSVRLGCSIESELFPGFPPFSSLQHPELAGRLDDNGVIHAVARIMEQTPSLEVLTLFLTPVGKPAKPGYNDGYSEEEYHDEDDHEQDDEYHHQEEDHGIQADREQEEHEQVPIQHVQRASSVSACLCLRRQLRQINLVHYIGNEAQRTLAKMLLRNALALQELCVVFPKGLYDLQMKQMNEIKGWVANKSANLMFL